jgi:N-acetylneuraminic acid mutarotase
MKKTYLLLSLSLLFLTVFSQKWFQMSDFPGSQRSRTSGFSIEDKGYLLFGKAGSQEFKELYEYNPSNDSWIMKSSFPGVGRYNAFAFDIDSFAYAGGGYNGSSSVYDFYQYNPKTDTWSLRMPYPGSDAVANIAVGLNGKGYVGGGTTVNSTPSSIEFYEYNPQSNIWTPKANLPFGARTGAITFTLNNLIFAGLGHNGGTNFNDLWAYNPVNNSWTQKASFPGASRIQSSVFIIDGKAVVGGGHQFSNSTPFLDYYIYNSFANSWSPLVQLVAGPSNSTGADFTVNNVGYLACGYDSTLGDTKMFWALKPVPTSIIKKSITKNNMVVYPNPSSGVLNIKSIHNVEIVSSLAIYSQEGKLVYSKLNFKPNEESINIETLNNGTYFITIRTNEKVFNEKVILLK